MQNEVISLIDTEIKRLQGLEETLRYIHRKTVELVTLRQQLLDIIASINPVDKAINEMRRQAVDILLEELNRALSINPEFSHPMFKNRLVQSVRDGREFQYISTSNTKVYVKINLDITAGNIEDYATAVDAVRQKRRIGPYRFPPASPELASHMWAEKYYGAGREAKIVQPPPNRKKKKKSDAKRTKEMHDKYWATMRDRMAAMQTLAPFWSLVNYGKVFMSSDWGGEAYPKGTPTYFVEAAQKLIQTGLDSIVMDQVLKLKELKTQLAKVEAAIRYLDNFKFDDESRNPKEILIGIIEKRLGDLFGRADPEKISKFADDILAGEEVDRRRLGGGVRMRARQLRLIVNEFNARMR